MDYARLPTQEEYDEHLDTAITIVTRRCPHLVDPFDGLIEEADDFIAAIVVWLAHCKSSLN